MNSIQYEDAMAHYEFLPLCDVLFNIISLASYFCDVVFDVVMGYALFERGLHVWFAVTLTFVASSLVVSQVLSFKWYLRSCALRRQTKEKWKTDDEKLSDRSRVVCWLVACLHVLQCGVLWRYFKLFIPVDLRFVKHEVRDLCMLRLLHAFCQAAPMLLLQLYLLFQEPASKEFSDLNLVSAALSLFSVCWALASFSKNVRLQNVHRLVLTWLGVVTQFFWRLGTVSSRVLALTVYAALYGHWVFLVVGLHWVSVFLWLVSPKNVFHGERISRRRKAAFSALIAVVYIFAYINLQEVNPRQKMATFYVVMFLENALLSAVWLAGTWNDSPRRALAVPAAVTLSFLAGLAFMLLYYRFFHVRRLRYEAGGRPASYDKCDSTQRLAATPPGVKDEIVKATHHAAQLESVKAVASHRGIPGVFNCRFATAGALGGGGGSGAGRKKKKPTTFVPPPAPVAAPAATPFWRRPLPPQHNHQVESSENDASSAGSRVNIALKLAEKKRKQLAELRVIEEEIRAGKIARPLGGGVSTGGGGDGSPPRQPIPRNKRHTRSPPATTAFRLLPPPRCAQRAETAEILLAPRYLEDPGLCFGRHPAAPPAYALSDDNSSSEHDSPFTDSAGPKDADATAYKSYRAASDIESVASLPRSYTLPREFKYLRRGRRTQQRARQPRFVHDNNSSDGDVDSGDETTQQDSAQPTATRAVRTRPFRGYARHGLHETKL